MAEIVMNFDSGEKGNRRYIFDDSDNESEENIFYCLVEICLCFPQNDVIMHTNKTTTSKKVILQSSKNSL